MRAFVFHADERAERLAALGAEVVVGDLAGSAPSAVDVAIYPFLAVFERAAATKAEALAVGLGLHPLRELYAGIRRWMGVVEAVPGYERAYPPHWRTA